MGIPQIKTNRTIVNKHDRGEDSGDSEEYDNENYRIMGIPQTKTNQGIAHKPERGGDYKDTEEYEEYEDEEDYEDYEESPKSYLIFVIFFTQAKFLENKIYNEIYTVNCQFTQ